MIAYFGIPPFIIYRSIKFQKPVDISEKEYFLLKKFGYVENTMMESFWELNKWNVKLIIVALCFLFVPSVINISEEASHALQVLGFIIMFYIIPKFITESIQYLKFKAEVVTFNKKIKELSNSSYSYNDFLNLYKKEILTSSFGKFLIKRFRKK